MSYIKPYNVLSTFSYIIYIVKEWISVFQSIVIAKKNSFSIILFLFYSIIHKIVVSVNTSQYCGKLYNNTFIFKKTRCIH